MAENHVTMPFERDGDLPEWVRCPECGNEQTDMGRNVQCEECDYGPMPSPSADAVRKSAGYAAPSGEKA